MNLDGIITVLNTPFTEDNRVDIDSVIRNTRYALDSKVAGFLVPAMAGEVDKLTEEERSIIVETVVAETAGTVPVIGGASAPTQKERLYYTEKLIKIGCSGILVSIPYTDKISYKRYIREINRLHPPLLMIQDWDFSGCGIPVPVIAELFNEIESFKSLKIETIPAGVKYTDVKNATSGRLHVAGGWAVMQMIEALDRGVNAFMPTGMHEIYVEIFKRYGSGCREDAKKLFNRILPVLAFANQHLDISVHFFKRLLYKQGIYSTPLVRQPILPFDKYHTRITDELITEVKKITADISLLQ
ncbi:MAG: dihydrodipicolinate synthase family protein [Spirochaetes bacterium]|nr:dihydrodipicolinate synthase family protein [Spirochaetota bacterium]